MKHSFSGLFSYEDRAGFPSLEYGFEGVVINIDNVAYSENELSFNLLLSYSFGRAFVDCFSKIDWAFVLTFDDVQERQGVSFNLRDTSKRYQGLSSLNYSACATCEGVNNEYFEGCIEAPITIHGVKSFLSPSFFLSVSLHNYLSNRIGIDVVNNVIMNYVSGAEVEMPTMVD